MLAPPPALELVLVPVSLFLFSHVHDLIRKFWICHKILQLHITTLQLLQLPSPFVVANQSNCVVDVEFAFSRSGDGVWRVGYCRKEATSHDFGLGRAYYLLCGSGIVAQEGERGHRHLRVLDVPVREVAETTIDVAVCWRRTLSLYVGINRGCRCMLHLHTPMTLYVSTLSWILYVMRVIMDRCRLESERVIW